MRRVPGQGGVQRLALRHGEAGDVGVVRCTQLRPAHDHRVRTGDRDDRRNAVLGHLPDPGERRRVAEPDAQVLPHLHRTADADHPAYQVRAAVAVRHEVGDLDLARLGDPPGDQHERVVDVPPAGVQHGAGWREQPATVILVAEQCSERRRRVEPGQAQPVDAAIASHERPGVAIADQRIILNPKGHPLSLAPAHCVAMGRTVRFLRRELAWGDGRAYWNPCHFRSVGGPDEAPAASRPRPTARPGTVTMTST